MANNAFYFLLKIFLLNICITICTSNPVNEYRNKNLCASCNKKTTHIINVGERIISFFNKIDYVSNVLGKGKTIPINSKKDDHEIINGKVNNKKYKDKNDEDSEHGEKYEQMADDTNKHVLSSKNNEEDSKDFYILRLNEFNFRWSMPFFIGSKQNKMMLGIITSSPITALYCNNPLNNEDNLKELKYNIEESENFKYVECNSNTCENANTDICSPLESYFNMLQQHKIKKRNCKKRFCDYVNNMNFLHIDDNLTHNYKSICAFDSTIDNDLIKGFYFKDSFYIYNTIKLFYNYFGCISENENLKFNNVLSGFIGLGTYNEDRNSQYPSILNSFIQKSMSKKNIFGLCFIENSGLISIGGYEKSILKKREQVKNKEKATEQKPDSDQRKLIRDTEKAKTEDTNMDQYDILWLNYSNPSKPIYSVFLQEVNMTNKLESLTYMVKMDAIIDSYNYFLSFPQNITAKLKNFVYKGCSESTADCSKLVSNGVLIIKNKYIKDFPNIKLVFNEGTLIIEPRDYIIHEGDDNFRVLINTSSVLKLGIPFFLNKYLIFDNEKKQIGISKSDCDFDNGDKITGIDTSLSNNTFKGPRDYFDFTNHGFFKKNKILKITIICLCVATSIIGSILYFCCK